MQTQRTLLTMIFLVITLPTLHAQDAASDPSAVPTGTTPQTDIDNSEPTSRVRRRAESSKAPVIDKSKLAGCDVHVVGIYMQESTTDDRVYVTVKNTGRPMVVVVCSYMETQWHLTIEPGAEVRQVIASGYFEQDVVAQKEVPVHIVVGSESRDPGYFWAYGWNTKEGRNVRSRVQELTDLEVTTFQGSYKGTRHTIDGTTGLVSELDRARTPAEETSRPELPDGTEAMPELVAAYHTQLMGAKSLGNADEVAKYEDVMAYALLSVRMQKKELQELLADMKKQRDELKAAGQVDDSRQLIELNKQISKLEENLALPDKYKEFLPQRPEAASAATPSGEKSNPAIDKSRLAGCDVHVLRVKWPKKKDVDDRVYLQVKNTGRPMVVVLSSGVSLEWKLSIDPDADLRQIIILGVHDVSVDKLPDNVPVVTRIGNDEDFWTTDWHTLPGRKLKQQIHELTGLDVTTFQGEFEADRHVIDGIAGLVTELDKMRPEEPTTSGDYEEALRICDSLLRSMPGKMSAGKNEDAQEVLDGLVWHLLKARLAQPQVRSELEELRKSLDQLRAKGEKEDSERVIQLQKKIDAVRNYLNLPDAEEYRRYLPSLPNASAASPAVDAEDTLLKLRAEEAELFATHGADHPEVKAIRQRIELTEQRRSGVADSPFSATAGPDSPSIAVLQKKKADAEAVWKAAEALTLEEAKRVRNEAATGSADTLELRGQLAQSVQNSLERQMQLQEIRVQLAAAELLALQQKQAARRKSAPLIIQRRVEDLLTGADLSWPQANNLTRANSPDMSIASTGDPAAKATDFRFNTPEELLEAMRQFPDGSDPAAILPMLADNAVEELAGMFLVTTTMFASVAPIAANQDDADPQSTQAMLQAVAVLGRSMKKDVTDEAREAHRRLSIRTNPLMAAFRKGPAYSDVDEFEADMRLSTGVLRNPREFITDVFDAMKAVSEPGNGSLMAGLQSGRKTNWTIVLSDNGSSATATPDQGESSESPGPTMNLTRTDHGWRIHKLFDRKVLTEMARGPHVSESKPKISSPD